MGAALVAGGNPVVAVRAVVATALGAGSIATVGAGGTGARSSAGGAAGGAVTAVGVGAAVAVAVAVAVLGVVSLGGTTTWLERGRSAT